MSKDKTLWSFSPPDDGSAFPEHFVAMLFGYATNNNVCRGSAWPRSKEVFETLINEVFAASLQSEEGRPVRFQLLYDFSPGRQVTSEFTNPLLYSANNLVKLAPTVDIGFRLIVVTPESPDSDTLKIVGISDPELSPLATKPLRVIGGGLSAHQPKTQGMKVSVFGPGWIRVEICGSSFELHNCSFRYPFSISGIKYIGDWYEEAAQSFDFSEFPMDGLESEVVSREINRRSNAGYLVRRTWGSILSKVSNARHGGTFLVVPECNADVSKLLSFKYELNSNRLQKAIQKRASFEPGLSNPLYRTSMTGTNLDDAHFSEKDLARTSDLFASFAAVDGAVVLERDLNLIGFGGEISNVNPPKENEVVKFAKLRSAQLDDKPLNLFGMRHRSAYRFCEKVEGAIAFVISQDGGLRVFWNPDGNVVLCDRATTEDWVSSLVSFE